MNTTGGELAPAVEDVLDDARARDPLDGPRVDVDARSLPAAIDATSEAGRTPVIAEVKPTSPTTDGTRDDDPVALAESMVDGGAAALSVLTEPEHFGGSAETLQRVRDAIDVPVLRKDFLLHERELDRVAADVVLLIARFLPSRDDADPDVDLDADPDVGVDGAADLETMLAAARDRGFQALVEVHTESELERALDAGATLVGVNNRDLGALEVDLGTFERVADSVPEGERDEITLVAESGVATTDDVARMRRAGADALLVGSAIMDGDVETTTRLFVTADGPVGRDATGTATPTTEGREDTDVTRSDDSDETRADHADERRDDQAVTNRDDPGDETR
jgi:indole-3-glycerol phosphate synthase